MSDFPNPRPHASALLALDLHCEVGNNTTNVLEPGGTPHMQLGLFLRRALITLARRGTVFQDRVAAVIVVAAVVAGCVSFWDRTGLGPDHDCRGGRFGLSTFGLVVGIQTLLAMALAGLPSIASRARPQEPRLAAGDPALERRDRAGHDGDRVWPDPRTGWRPRRPSLSWSRLSEVSSPCWCY